MATGVHYYRLSGRPDVPTSGGRMARENVCIHCGDYCYVPRGCSTEEHAEIDAENRSRQCESRRAKTPTLDQVIEAIEADENLGFCLACGEEADGCEPDAENYKCQSCGLCEVFGAEQILIMGAARE